MQLQYILYVKPMINLIYMYKNYSITSANVLAMLYFDLRGYSSGNR